MQQILFGEDQSSTLAISAEPAPLMSSACSRPPKILNGHHDDDDDDVECNDCHGDEDEEGKNDEKGYNHKINHRIFLSSQYCAIQLCWILGGKIECAGLSKLVF